jgi:hypothetical protein
VCDPMLSLDWVLCLRSYVRVLMSKELCDSPLKIKKSSRSGVLLISVGR